MKIYGLYFFAVFLCTCLYHLRKHFTAGENVCFFSHNMQINRKIESSGTRGRNVRFPSIVPELFAALELHERETNNFIIIHFNYDKPYLIAVCN